MGAGQAKPGRLRRDPSVQVDGSTRSVVLSSRANPPFGFKEKHLCRFFGRPSRLALDLKRNQKDTLGPPTSRHAQGR